MVKVGGMVEQKLEKLFRYFLREGTMVTRQGRGKVAFISLSKKRQRERREHFRENHESKLSVVMSLFRFLQVS